LDLTVANMRWVKPLDVAMLREMAQSHQGLVTLEEGSKMGGAGSAVMEALQAMSLSTPVLCLGMDDVFIEHGDPAALMKQIGLTAQGIQQAVLARWPTLEQAEQSTVVPLKKAS
jgi:1-deoxy-D-xylulose-5-phosphate synthase